MNNISYLSQTRDLADTPWIFTLLTPLEDLRREAINQGMLVAVAFALVAFLLIAWNERRKVIATRLAAREALEEANNRTGASDYRTHRRPARQQRTPQGPDSRTASRRGDLASGAG
jgi:C4-dicarboxylate-specific signal transduction histidine kinase